MKLFGRFLAFAHYGGAYSVHGSPERSESKRPF
jgi:hypothetical protein